LIYQELLEKYQVTLTLQEIATIINKNSHTTVSISIKEVEDALQMNEFFKDKIKKIEDKIKTIEVKRNNNKVNYLVLKH